jgi:hypothetical protein
MRRRVSPEDDPMLEVPERLRVFDPAWREVAAQGPDGLAEALEAAVAWRAERRAWRLAHGYRGSPLEWLLADVRSRRDLHEAAQAVPGRWL